MKATNTTKWIVLVGLALTVASGSFACKDKGALEQAGESVDATIDDVTHPNEGPLEKAGRKVSESVDDVTN